MTIDEFVEIYERNYGEKPSQEIIEEYCGTTNSSGQNYENERSHYNRYSRGSHDLFLEIKDVCATIAQSAHRNKEALDNSSQKVSQFSYMLYIFLAKSLLYFLFQNSLDDGYDFRNM